MTVYLLSLSVLATFLIISYFIYLNTLRIKAKFALYKARDEFVYLVASGKIKEGDRFFKFFYSAINTMLREAPHVGLDDIIQVIPRESDHITKARKDSFRAILDDPVMADKEISNTVNCFFDALVLMILSHSSITRVFYVIALKIVAPFIKRFNSALNHRIAVAAIATVSAFVFIPGSARRGLDAINYMDHIQQHNIRKPC